MSSCSGLFRGVSYSGEPTQPRLMVGEHIFAPLNKSFTLEFDLSTRYCLGWRDLENSTSHPCPDRAVIDPKYDTCPACQKRTGFNPAFYNVASVSPQQEKLNQEPHILYLAHFGGDTVKVGISRAKRGIHRLLEQGARSALVLDTFPTALIARSYEAKIAALPGLRETFSIRTKLTLLERSYDHIASEKLLFETKRSLETTLNTKFSGNEVRSFDDVFLSHTFAAEPFTPLPTPEIISGTCVAVAGSILIMRYDDHQLALPLKPLTGYKLAVSKKVVPLDLPPRQASLF